MATDTFATNSAGLDSPYENAANAIVGALDYVTRAIYVGGTGNLVLTMQGGQEAIFYSVPAGTVLRVRATAILSAAVGSPGVTTTTTQMVALW